MLLKSDNLSVSKLLIKAGFLSGLLMLVFYCFVIPPASAKVSLNSDEKEFFTLINNYRKDKGLDPLKISKKLSDSALLMAQDMADKPSLINHEHKDSLGRSPSERAAIYGYTDGVGENLAAGYSTAQKAFDAWKNSADHNANMLSKDYTVMGIALVTTDNNYKWYWVNTFGETEHSSDLLDQVKYGLLDQLDITVTDSNGNLLSTAKLKVFTKGGSNLANGKINKKGKKSFTLDPKKIYYVRASASKYKTYTKEVKMGSKNQKKVQIWLEKN